MADMDAKEAANRRNLNHVIQRMLILGLILSAAVLVAGLVCSAIAHQPVASKTLSFKQVLDGLSTGSPASFLSLGILLLIATPVLRVVGSLFEFVATRDWHYVLVTSLVLLILAISAFVGIQ
jgi:uncharacterized membrane protein